MGRTILRVVAPLVALSLLLGGCSYGGLFGWGLNGRPDRRQQSGRVETERQPEQERESGAAEEAPGRPEATPQRPSGGTTVISDVVPGDYTARENTVLSGIVSGDLTVEPGVTFECSGIVSGSVTVEAGGRFECSGTVSGAVINRGTAVISGIVSGGVSGDGDTEIVRGAIIAGVRY